MGSSLSRIQAIIYDHDFPRFPRPDNGAFFAEKNKHLTIFLFLLFWSLNTLNKVIFIF